MSASTAPTDRVLNINIGVLGHVDSGKTSLAKALSEVISTAALDKQKQSQERGITIDLGFSAFTAPIPEHLKEEAKDYDLVQFTLVDCPGHASLLKTIIGGAQIIDIMLLVVDVKKGIQTQTAECLVIGEILADKMIVVLNKIDLLENPDEQLPKVKKKLQSTFAATKFGSSVKMVTVAANPGGSKTNLKLDAAEPEEDAEERAKPDVSNLVSALLSTLRLPKRRSDGDFYFAVDHCFKGSRGSILTGTVLHGSASVGQTIELPSLKIQRPIKSMQMFRKPVQQIQQGDRAGIMITDVQADSMERGIVAAPDTVGIFKSVIASVHKIRFHKFPCRDKQKFHITIGHFTCLATAHFVCPPPFQSGEKKQGKELQSATQEAESKTKKSGVGKKGKKKGSKRKAASASVQTPDLPEPNSFDFDRDYPYAEELQHTGPDYPKNSQYAVLEFDKPVWCPARSRLIGSRLDLPEDSNACRIAFAGKLIQGFDFTDTKERQKIKVFREKLRIGSVDRVVDEFTLIGKDLFSKDTDLSAYVNCKIELDSGEQGILESTFGKGGKFKARFPEGVAALKGHTGLGKGKGKGPQLKAKIVMRLRKYLNSENKKYVPYS